MLGIEIFKANTISSEEKTKQWVPANFQRCCGSYESPGG